ncbi:MAG: CDF family Co(II)/Ni(II) efflux transporter DmeF [Pseudomonadota bacterium]|nr:CDF family Co(II)/Ni(II) efflux transporter DmeF [Pseudomonadota bacterium]
MTTPDHAPDHAHGLWTHDHVFLGHGHARAERRARLVAALTAAFMAVEIAAGLAFGSMALLADGIHMATHVGALGLAAAAYWLARRHAGDARFTFGSGKFGDLAAFVSAIVLGIAGLAVAAESVDRLVAPVTVHYREALLIATLGLAVNLVCAFILGGGHEHAHDHGPEHSHNHDHNLRAAYIHVLADAATSLLAIAALSAGLLWGARWLDPAVGIVGAGVIGSWAYGLVRDSGLVLLDAQDDPELAAGIRALIEGELGARISDLHLWRLGPGHKGLIVSLVSPDATSAEDIKRALAARFPALSHVTVEVAVCADCAA